MTANNNKTQQGTENLEAKGTASDLAANTAEEQDTDIASGIVDLADQEEYIDEP